MAGGTQILGPSLVNDVRFGWTRFVNNNAGRDAFTNNVNKDLKIPGVNPTDNPAFWGVPNVTITGYSGFGEPTNVYLTHDNIWEWHDTMNWTRGKHIFRFGASIEPIHYDQTGNQFALGGFDFNGTVTGNPAVAGSRGLPIADFLLGYPDQSQSGVQPADAALRSTYRAVFAGDSYRVTPKLTLEYSLRYEYLPPFKDINDASANLADINTSNRSWCVRPIRAPTSTRTKASQSGCRMCRGARQAPGPRLGATRQEQLRSTAGRCVQSDAFNSAASRISGRSITCSTWATPSMTCPARWPAYYARAKTCRFRISR